MLWNNFRNIRLIVSITLCLTFSKYICTILRKYDQNWRNCLKVNVQILIFTSLQWMRIEAQKIIISAFHFNDIKIVSDAEKVVWAYGIHNILMLEIWTFLNQETVLGLSWIFQMNGYKTWDILNFISEFNAKLSLFVRSLYILFNISLLKIFLCKAN